MNLRLCEGYYDREKAFAGLMRPACHCLDHAEGSYWSRFTFMGNPCRKYPASHSEIQ